MSENRAVINRIWSRVVLEELARLGVEQVCVAPGSRSTPLITEANDNHKLTLHSHFDERGLGFLALGMAKACHKPVAIIVTSGTAVANLLPAIAESRLTGEKLVVLTADRPVELIECGANQAINQVGIFSEHVTQTVNLPSPTAEIPLGWLLTTIDYAMFEQAQLGGSVHINCPYPEPLYTNEASWNNSDYCLAVSRWNESHLPYSIQRQSHMPIVDDISGMMNKKGIVLIGSVTLEQATSAKKFAERLGWPVLCDPQSGVSSNWASFDIWMQNTELKDQLNQCDAIIQFGGRLVSKRLNAWVKTHVMATGCPYYYLSSSRSRHNQSHLPQTHIVTDIESWVSKQLDIVFDQNVLHSGWADSLCDAIARLSDVVEQIGPSQSLCELAIATTVENVGHQCDLFVGNSLIVRLFDMFARIDSRAVYSNRGASGIDGLVATAVGVQSVTDKPIILFIGDTSLLYDLNSMALLARTSQPFVLVVTNNDGGAIFDLLPVAKEQKQSLYQMPHGFDFRHAASQFRLGYACPESLEQYQETINQHIENGSGGLVVEVKVPNEQAATHIRAIVEQVNAI